MPADDPPPHPDLGGRRLAAPHHQADPGVLRAADEVHRARHPSSETGRPSTERISSPGRGRPRPRRRPGTTAVMRSADLPRRSSAAPMPASSTRGSSPSATRREAHLHRSGASAVAAPRSRRRCGRGARRRRRGATTVRGGQAADQEGALRSGERRPGRRRGRTARRRPPPPARCGPRGAAGRSTRSVTRPATRPPCAEPDLHLGHAGVLGHRRPPPPPAERDPGAETRSTTGPGGRSRDLEPARCVDDGGGAGRAASIRGRRAAPPRGTERPACPSPPPRTTPAMRPPPESSIGRLLPGPGHHRPRLREALARRR